MSPRGSLAAGAVREWVIKGGDGGRGKPLGSVTVSRFAAPFLRSKIRIHPWFERLCPQDPWASDFLLHDFSLSER